MAGHPGYWRDDDGEAVAAHEAEAVWATHAGDVLRDVASRFGELIDYTALGVQVQERSGIHTRVPVLTWMGGVLRRVMQTARSTGEPPLSVLAVPRRGDGGAEQWTTGRMQCYRRYCPDIPAEITLVETKRPVSSGTSRQTRPRAATASRRSDTTRPATRARAEEPPAFCPRCFLALPATGVCDTCG